MLALFIKICGIFVLDNLLEGNLCLSNLGDEWFFDSLFVWAGRKHCPVSENNTQK